VEDSGAPDGWSGKVERIVGLMQTAIRSWKALACASAVDCEFSRSTLSVSPVTLDIGDSFAGCMKTLKMVINDLRSDVVRDQVVFTTQYFLISREVTEDSRISEDSRGCSETKRRCRTSFATDGRARDRYRLDRFERCLRAMASKGEVSRHI